MASSWLAALMVSPAALTIPSCHPGARHARSIVMADSSAHERYGTAALPALPHSFSITRRTLTLASALAATASLPAHAAHGMMEFENIRDTALTVDPANAPANNTYSTISAALAAAPSGGVVKVRAGTYNERVVIRKPVKLLASTGAVLSWKSDKPYEAALDVDVSGSSVADSKVDVLVSGLAIRHYSPSIAQNYGVYVHSPTECKVKLFLCDVASSSGSGIGVEGGNVTIFSCTVHDCKNHGVLYVGSGATGRVQRCVVENCKLNGLFLRDGASPTITDNLLKGNAQYGAALIDCRGVLVNDNELVRNGKGAVNGECDEFGE